MAITVLKITVAAITLAPEQPQRIGLDPNGQLP
jgi:hypothetical protein